VSRLKPIDAVFIFSVDGGNLEKNVSANLVRAVQYAKEIGAKVIGVVGRDGGYTAKVGDAVSIVPTGQSRSGDPTFGSVSGGDLAPDRDPSAAQEPADEVGRDAVMTRPANPAVFLERDGVLNEAMHFATASPTRRATSANSLITASARASLDALKTRGVPAAS